MSLDQVPTYSVCGVAVAAVSLSEAAEVIVESAARRRKVEVHLCNAYTLSLVSKDQRLLEALLQSDLNLPDGTPVARLGRRAGGGRPVRGPKLVVDVMRAGASLNLGHFLYGGAPGVAEEMAARLEARIPGLRISGLHSPPFREPTDKDLAELAARAKAANSDVVWVGLGTPKQDYVVSQLASYCGIPVIPVGAAFDFLSGRVKPAPRVFHGSGFEWAYRLAREPRRLWRRYLFGNARFVINVVRLRRQ